MHSLICDTKSNKDVEVGVHCRNFIYAGCVIRIAENETYGIVSE